METVMSLDALKFLPSLELSPEFARRLADFLRFDFPSLPGHGPDPAPGFFADMQLVADLREAFGPRVTLLGDSAQPIAAHLMPTLMELQLICDRVRQDAWMRHDFIAVGADERAHVFAARLREQGLGCKKLFIHGHLGATQGPLGLPVTTSRTVPLVFVRQPSGEALAYAVDLSLFPEGPVRPAAYLGHLLRDTSLSLEITSASQMRAPTVHGWDLRDWPQTVAEAKKFLKGL